jgi:hypothetical protein
MPDLRSLGGLRGGGLKRGVDPRTGEGRRVDMAVFDKETGTAQTVEVTSMKANKSRQTGKEERIFLNNPDGVYVRDPRTGQLYKVPGPSRLERLP